MSFRQPGVRAAHRATARCSQLGPGLCAPALRLVCPFEDGRIRPVICAESRPSPRASEDDLRSVWRKEAFAWRHQRWFACLSPN